MPFTIVRDDITHVHVDAIVNAANEQLRHGGGVCGAIFAAAGARDLQRACDKIGHCDTGGAVATPGFALPARYVIHTVGPIWHGGTMGERELLASCYKTSLELAHSLECQSIAFPLISAGIYGYPKREALQVAQDTILTFLATHEMDVRLVLFGPRSMEIAESLRLRVQRYIDDVYVDASGYRERASWESMGSRPLNLPRPEAPGAYSSHESAPENPAYPDAPGSWGSAPQAAPPYGDMFYSSRADRTSVSKPGRGESQKGKKQRKLQLPRGLKKLMGQLDAGFSETLLALIDKRGYRDAEVYKKANISRQHFSKIRSNPNYRPTKTTVLALAVALELTLEETQMLLERAGFALSHADRRDVIVEFFIREGIYDVFQINDALFAFDQPLLA